MVLPKVRPDGSNVLIEGSNIIMKITCKHGEVTDHRRQIFHKACGQPAVIVILNAEFHDARGDCETCGYDSEPTYVGYCEQHAAEAVHEARQCHAEDEFIVINLSAEARLESVRKYVIDSEPGIMRADRTDILAIINDEVPALTLEGGCDAFGIVLDRNVTDVQMQTYEDYVSDEPNAYGIPDGLTRAEYEARYLATFGGAL